MLLQSSPYQSSDFEQAPLEASVVSLALQGGGSLGAYTWGVLDMLLEDARLDIEGVTGASAGAINAVAFGVGFAQNGRSGARERLRLFWEALAGVADRHRQGRRDQLRTLMRAIPNIRSSAGFYALTISLTTDFRMDPETIEPLRGTLASMLDFDVLGETDSIKVFVNVTDVQTGQPEVFSGNQINTDVICASCAVPFLFAPVEIAGRHYWDGGLLGNPAIYPVIYGCEARDVVLVETQPTTKEAIPSTAADVMSRTLELASTAGLMREVRAINFVAQLLDESPRPGLRAIRLHRIPVHPELVAMPDRRRFRADLGYFHRLRDFGREAAREWLTAAL